MPLADIAADHPDLIVGPAWAKLKAYVDKFV